MEETGLEESIFPVDIELKDIREAVQGRTDFREVTGPDYIIFIYFLGMAKDIFPDPATAPDQRTAYLWRLRRECRGIAFDPETGKVKSRRFHKFFNGEHPAFICEQPHWLFPIVNEIEETQADKIDLSKPYVVLEKLDGMHLTTIAHFINIFPGSMISPFETQGKLRLVSS